MLKKIIAIALTVIMLFSVFASPTGAAYANSTISDTEQVEITVEETVKLVPKLIEAIHNLVGNILAVFDVRCPFCKKIHETVNKDEKEDGEDLNLCTVTFDLNYENAPKIEILKVEMGQCADYPDLEIREGFQFIGWYKDGTIFDFSQPITEDIYLVAYWYDENDTIDSDGDGLTDELELLFGTDQNGDDTDGDGVSDWYELNYLNSDPLSEDNSCEDPDEDGLTNAEECELGTDPSYYDTDSDHISDYDEVYVYHTDPLNEDTDGDGVIDGIEIQNSTDPLVFEEEFENETTSGVISESNPVIASATVVTGSEGAGTLEISEVTHADNYLVSASMPGYLGSAYDFTVDGEFETATLTFEYDESLGEIGDDFQPRIYYVNTELGELEELPNQIVENGKVTAVTTHFSVYVLLNKVYYDLVRQSDIISPIYGGESTDIVFLIDDGERYVPVQTYFSKMQEITKEFIGRLGDNQRASIQFVHRQDDWYSGEFTNDKETLYDELAMHKGTIDTNDFLENRINALTTAISTVGCSDAKNKIIVYISHGLFEGETFNTKFDCGYDFIAECARAANVSIFSIYARAAFFSVADPYELETLATESGGMYFEISSADEVGDICDEIDNGILVRMEDMNNDKIPDYYAEFLNSGELTLSNGTCGLVGVLDMYGDSVDWDGDGLLNGEEVYITVDKNGNVVAKLKSNPLLPDGDGDGYSDYEEIKNMKTDPLKITKAGGEDIADLSDNDGYASCEFANNLSNDGIFDFCKISLCKETLINYFYDYASAESIEACANEIKEQEKRERALEIIDCIANIVKFAKSISDFSSDLFSDNDDVKNILDDFSKKHATTLDLFKDKNYDEIIKNYSNLKNIETVYGTLKKYADVIKSWDFSDLPDSVAAASKVAAASAATLKAIQILHEVNFEKLAKNLRSLSYKYQVYMGGKTSSGLTVNTIFSIVTDAADGVIEMEKIYNTYSKLLANAAAFEENIGILEHMSTNKDFYYCVRKASGKILKVMLDKSNEEFIEQMSYAMGQKALETFLKIGIEILSEANPYVKVANMVYKILDITLKACGIYTYVEISIVSLCYSTISESCVNCLNKLIKLQGNYYSYSSGDTETIKQYLTQLVQSRVVGEKTICDYHKKASIINWMNNILAGMWGDNYDVLFSSTNQLLYMYADDLKLTLSHSLPRYYNGEWMTHKEACAEIEKKANKT